MGKETWKDIPGYEGLYQVSNMGKMRSFYKFRRIMKRPRKMMVNPGIRGYPKVILFNGSKKDYSVHSLVLKAFVSERPKGMQINHKNGIKTDNKLSNLEYVTAKENVQHALNVLKRKRHGEFSSNSKLKTKDVLDIKIFLLNDNKIVDIARRYNVTTTTISCIKFGKSWRHLL